MRSREIIAELKGMEDKYGGWCDASVGESMEIALTYIADEAGPADMNTIKRVANIALGREQS